MPCSKNQAQTLRYRIKNVALIDVLSNPKILYLDFDKASPIPNPEKILKRLRTIGLKARRIRYSRTWKGWHVQVETTIALSPAETVAAQAILESDPQREAMNLRRAISLRIHKHSKFWKKRWNILFSKKL